ncbi:MAG TPA: GGDEF domain-containing protein [Verrucomicrobiae bacterium]|nr:GGDEF domain-containing protein [Verrucomicrobiae bacterium]
MNRVPESPPSRLALLQQQQAEGYWSLRFRPELEPEYRVDHLADVVPRRLMLLVSALILIGAVPLLDAMFLHPPTGFAARSHLVQYAFMIPALLLAGLCTLWTPLRRVSEIAALLAAFVVSAGVIYQRQLGAAYGHIVPSELVAVVLTGTAVMAGLRTAYFAPTVALIVALSSWSELRTFGGVNSTYYVILAQSMLGAIAMIGAAMQEFHSCASWLQRKLLEELTLRDPLSGLVNGRGLREVYPRVFATAMREHRPLLTIAVDIDHFKAYNDHYGHLTGDDTLRRVASALARHGRRGNDIAARSGGEEFVLVWYDVIPEHAARLLEAMRQEVERLNIRHAGIGERGVVTVSIGAVCAVPGPRTEPESLLRQSDEQLYRAKQRGRNCVSLVFEAAEGPPAETQAHGLRPS